MEDAAAWRVEGVRPLIGQPSNKALKLRAPHGAARAKDGGAHWPTKLRSSLPASTKPCSTTQP